MRNKILHYLVICLFIIPLSVRSQTGSITIEGDLSKPVIFTADDLKAMNRIEIGAKDMSGQTHTYSGVAVADIFKKAGIIKPESHRDNLTKYVLVKSSDNYEVLFSLTELDSAFSGRTIILADSMDGKPLPLAKGPYRLAVPGEEKRQARWIWGVTTFIIKLSAD